MCNLLSLLVCLILVASEGLTSNAQNEVDPQDNSHELTQNEYKKTIGPVHVDLKFSALIQVNLGQYLSNLSKNSETYNSRKDKRQVPTNPSLVIESRQSTTEIPETSPPTTRYPNVETSDPSLLTSTEIPETSVPYLNTSHPSLQSITEIPEANPTAITNLEETNQTDSNTIYEALLKVSDDQQNITASLSKLFKKQDSTDNMIRQLMKDTKSISHLQHHLHEQQQSPHSDNVHVMDGTSGSIVYSENLMSYSNRKFWVLERTTSVSFSIGHMDLGSNAHLTFTGIAARGEKNEIFFDSQSETTNATEVTDFTIKGCVIVVTLIMKEVHPESHPSFSLTFTNTKDDSRPDKRKYATKVVTTDGLTYVSFPENNRGDYPSDVSYLWLIAPFSAKPFELTLRFLETENCTVSKPKDFLKIFSIQHTATRSTYELQGRPERSNMYCGREKEINPPEFIGYSTASILFFSSDRSITWSGIKVQVKTFDLPQALPIFS